MRGPPAEGVTRVRNPALISLSREHHYALVFCRTVRRVVEQCADDRPLIRQWVENARAFLRLDLRPHFEAEEQVLFPACRTLGLAPRVESLEQDHRALEAAAGDLREDAPATLATFARMLEAHIRREERELFPEIDARLEEPSTGRIREAIEARLGKAETPRDPALLQEPRLRA